MSANHKSRKMRISLKEIPLQLIDRDPKQPRQTFYEDTLEGLADSMEQDGIVQPIVVKRNPKKKGRFILVIGERRWRAAQKNGHKKIWAIVRQGDLDTFVFSLIENYNRENLNPIDEARAFKRAHDEKGMTWEEISKRTKVSVTTILNRVKMLEVLPPEIHEMICQRKLPKTQALSLANVKGQFNLKDRRLIHLANDILAGRISPVALQADSPRKHQWIHARIPTMPEELFRRILKLRWQARSLVLTFESFLKLPSAEQQRVLRALPQYTKDHMHSDFKDLVSSLTEFVSYIEKQLVPRQLDPEK